LPTINVNPMTLGLMLERAHDGDEFLLDPGDYLGPFAVTKNVTLRGTDLNATIWAGDEPAVVVEAPGVRLENLTIERNVGWELQAVIAAVPGSGPRLKGVALKGQAPEAIWEESAWQLPDAHLGTIRQGDRLVAQLKLEVGTPCDVRCDQPWLQLGTTHLFPGPQTLQVQVGITPDMLPGSLLMAAVELVPRGTSEMKRFHVQAEVAAAHQWVAAEGSPRPPVEHTASETWQFLLTRAAAEQLVGLLRDGGSEPTDAGFTQDTRHEAQGLFLSLFGHREHTWHVRRREAKQASEEFWQLSLAWDAPGQDVPAILKAKGRTLCLFAALRADGVGALSFVSASLRSTSEGHADGYSHPVAVRWLPQAYGERGQISPAVLEAIRALPHLGSVRPTDEQRRMWEAFLTAEERIAQQRQFCVPFEETNRATAGRVVSLRIDPRRALLGPGMPELEAAEFWQRLKKAKNQSVKYFVESPHDADRRGLDLGTIEGWREDDDIVRVRLAEDLLEREERGLRTLGDQGWIVFTAFGDLTQVRRKQQGMRALEQGKVQNIFLAEFLFDPSQAREARELVTLQREELLDPSRLNESQKRAVEKALSVPDLMLVQGPPGTGKTTVIAEICYQIARRGGRTLIASQSNLAVDNALSRLVANPSIRALRKGRADKVEEEGLPYLEDNVINTWLTSTASNCDGEMSQREDNIRLFRDLLGNAPRFAAYLAREEHFDAASQAAAAQREALEKAVLAQDERVALLREIQAKRERTLGGIRTFAEHLDTLDLASPEVEAFLQAIQPLMADDQPCQEFVRRYHEALAMGTALGQAPPYPDALRGAAWLRAQATEHHRHLLGWQQQIQSGLHALDSARRQQQLLETLDDEIARLEAEGQSKQAQAGQARQALAAKQEENGQLMGLFQDLESLRTSLPPLVTAALDRALGTTTPDAQAIRDLLRPLLPTWPQTAPWFQAVVQAAQGQLAAARTDLREITERRVGFAADEAAVRTLIREVPEAAPADIRAQVPPLDAGGPGPYANAATPRQLASAAADLKRQLKAAFVTKKLLGLIPIGGSWNMEEVRRVLQRAQQLEVQLDELGRAESQQREADAQRLEQAGMAIAARASQALQQALEQTLTSTRSDETELRRRSTVLASEEEACREGLYLKTAERTQQAQALTALREQGQYTLRGLAPSAPQALRAPLEQLMAIELAPDTFSQLLASGLETSARLLAQVETLEPRFLLDRTGDAVQATLQSTIEQREAAERDQTSAHQALSAAQAALVPDAALETERGWWREAWQAIPTRLQPSVPAEGLHAPLFLRRINALFDAWQRELAREERHMDRYRCLVTDWVQRLRQPTEQDRHELRQVYLDNANVIGITCNQAASPQFNEAFNSFDAVIVDEVSKATPPELVLPALKGKKVILIGDHKQLPPMLETTTLSELAEELQMPAEDVEFLKVSLFKQLFERAPDGIKEMLSIQYRMHPSIMNAINQFYSHRLECGLVNPDAVRAHELDSPSFPPERHLAWVDMPLAPSFHEEQEGTSFINRQEAAVIQRILDELETAWAPKVAAGRKPKEIAIITFYLPQLKLLREVVNGGKAYPSLAIRLGTVDRFQGMEREVVLVSTVRNNTHGTIGFAKEPERINVAFSRAQQLLVVVGCHALFQNHRGAGASPYVNVTTAVRQAGGFLDVSRFLV
jgi:hypothetical protein